MAKRKTYYEVTGAEKKYCQCCGKLLRLYVQHEYSVPSGDPLPPSKKPDTRRIELGRKPHSLCGKATDVVEFWEDGPKSLRYHGYSELWCSTPCAMRFANAAWRGGQRIVGWKAKEGK